MHVCIRTNSSTMSAVLSLRGPVEILMCFVFKAGVCTPSADPHQPTSLVHLKGQLARSNSTANAVAAVQAMHHHGATVLQGLPP